MSDLSSLSKHVVDIFKSTVEYNDYRILLDRIKEEPRLYDRVLEYRRKNFNILQDDIEDDIAQMDDLVNEYDDLLGNPLVNDFITAEAAFCKMVRDFTTSVTDELEFDI
ncbi:MAG: YlbF family regulator [Lachnospiraceae bacterium]|nr:YlbF family regulator [Lachnospiraceae bacterium]